MTETVSGLIADGSGLVRHPGDLPVDRGVSREPVTTTKACEPDRSGGRKWLRFAPLVAGIVIAGGTRTMTAMDPGAVIAGVIVLASAGVLVAQAVGHSQNVNPARRLLGAAAGISATVLLALPGALRSVLLGTPAVIAVFGGAIVLHLACGIGRAYGARARLRGDFRERAELILSEFVPRSVARAAAAESMVLWYAVAWGMRPDIPEKAIAFSYHRNLRPLLWAFIAASLLEIGVVHVLVWKFWSPKAAWVLFALSELGLLYFIGLANSLSKLPLLVTEDGVRVRTGILINLWLPMDQIDRVQTMLNCGDLKREGFFKASLISYPNTLIELNRPVIGNDIKKGRREVNTIAVHPDDAPSFVTAITRMKQAALNTEKVPIGPSSRMASSLNISQAS